MQFGLGERTAWFGCMGQYDIPRWREGGVTAQLCAIYLDDDGLHDPVRRGMEMVWNLHHQIARNSDLVLATTVREIRQAKAEGRIALVLTFEGCESLAARGHSDETIRKFLGANYLRVFEQARLVESQRRHRVDPRGSPCGEVAGGERHHYQQ